MDIEALRDELVEVANVVMQHKEVAEKLSISVAYLTQIRSGKNLTTDSEKNRGFIQKVITTYRAFGKEKIESLNGVL